MRIVDEDEQLSNKIQREVLTKGILGRVDPYNNYNCLFIHIAVKPHMFVTARRRGKREGLRPVMKNSWQGGARCQTRSISSFFETNDGPNRRTKIMW
jgi:hypothetical protein